MSDPSTVVAGGPTPRNRPPFVTAGYTPEVAADIVAIGNLIARYAHLLDSDTTEPQRVVDLFATDGSVEPLYENAKRHAGHPAILTWFTGYLAASRAGSRLRRHLISSTRIEVDGDRGWAFSMLDAQGIDQAADQLRFYAGHYEDDLVRRDGRWFFANRRIALDFQWHAPAYSLNRNGKQVIAGEMER
jgi:hypothetical protein